MKKLFSILMYGKDIYILKRFICNLPSPKLEREKVNDCVSFKTVDIQKPAFFDWCKELRVSSALNKKQNNNYEI